MLDNLYLFLTKIGFTEPLHSPITHMPIGLAVGALLFFMVAIIFKQKQFIMTARHASILAFIFVFPTILFGVMDWIHFYNATLFTPIKIKMALAAVSLITLGTGIIVGSEIKLHSVTMAMIYAITVIAMIGLGFFGSGIIYGRGLEVTVHKQPTAVQVADTAGTKRDTMHTIPVKTDSAYNSRINDSLRKGSKNPENPKTGKTE